ncbi:MAG: D-xylose ABC transporter substrate-binding protein [Deltaproteobacteria bacterium]|jgi:D-xylose transport system substrate-binding protein|nr:D-xylose ABC transporter substrate-binding protein [Deltaproteobacteria bacterium]
MRLFPLGRLLTSVCILLLLLPCVGQASGTDGRIVVGVSWSNFQEERWKTDEAAIRDALDAAGARYLSSDAQSSSEKQIADIEGLIARGADVLVVLAQDADAIHPALALARAERIPVIAYDRLVEAPGVFYISFDNVEVGRLQARSLQAVRPNGRYVFIKGSAQDPNADFVHAGQLEVLRPSIDAGRIEVVGEQYVDGWLPEVAQRVMEQILTANDDRVDAVVCSNDGMAGAVVAALSAQGLQGVPVSGQDGDHAALNRVARGLQTVSVWKDARALGKIAAHVALELARGRPAGEIDAATIYRDGPRGLGMDAILLRPVPITRENLEVVIDAGWVSRETVCRAVSEDPPPACRADAR